MISSRLFLSVFIIKTRQMSDHPTNENKQYNQ